MPRIKVQDIPYSLRVSGTGKMLASATSGLSGGHSISGKFMVGAFTGSTMVIAENAESSTNLEGVCILASGIISAGYYSGSYNSASGVVVAKNVWYDFVYTFNGTTTKLYINNSLQGGTTPPQLSTTVGLSIASDTASGRQFNGWVSGIRYYNRELTAAEVTTLYSGGAVTSGLVGEYKLTEGSGTTATDSSGNNNSGTITNGTWSTDTPTKLRTASSNRVAIQDVKSSLSFNGTNTYIQTPVVPNVNSFSFATKIYWHPPVLVGGRTIFHCQDASGGILIKHQNPSSRKLGVDTYNVDSATNLMSPSPLSAGWHTIGVTRDATTTRMYVDGVLVNSVVCTMTAAASSVSRIGYSLASVQDWLGNMSGVILSNTATFTAAEMLAYHQSGTIPTSATAIYKLDEGAGTTAYDSSGNGNHGTITSGTFTSDVPTKKRKVIGENMVYNGDFSYIPPVNVATTTSSRFVDGTAGGSTTNDLFGRGYKADMGSGSAMFDSSTLYNGKPMFKLTTNAGGWVYSPPCVSNSAANVLKWGIPCLPNTSYTFSVAIKTNVLSGAADRGAYFRVEEFTGAGASVASNDTTFVKTTTDTTVYTKTFTTSATTRFLLPQCYNRCSDGAGTLALEAWFADIQLRPTTSTTRTAV